MNKELNQPKKDGWYLAYDMNWDRVLYKNGKWIAQTKTRHTGNPFTFSGGIDRHCTDVMIRDDITAHVTAWQELPDKPEDIWRS